MDRAARSELPVALRLSLGIDGVTRRIGRLVGLALAVMVLVGAYNAIARSVQRGLDFRLTTNALLETQWYLFGLLFLLGAGYTLRRDEHVRVDVLHGGLPARGRHWTDLAGALVLLLPFCAFGLWTGIDFAWESISRGEWSGDPGGLPRWPLKLCVPLCFLLLGLQGVSEAIKRYYLLRGYGAEDVGLREPGPSQDAGEGA